MSVMFTCRACLSDTENDDDLCNRCNSSKCDECAESLDEFRLCPRCSANAETDAFYAAAVADGRPPSRR